MPEPIIQKKNNIIGSCPNGYYAIYQALCKKSKKKWNTLFSNENYVRTYLFHELFLWHWIVLTLPHIDFFSGLVGTIRHFQWFLSLAATRHTRLQFEPPLLLLICRHFFYFLLTLKKVYFKFTQTRNFHSFLTGCVFRMCKCGQFLLLVTLVQWLRQTRSFRIIHHFSALPSRYLRLILILVIVIREITRWRFLNELIFA